MRTRSVRFLLPFLAALAGCTSDGDIPVPSDVPPPAVSGIEAFPRTRVPLPPGQWQEIARDDRGVFQEALRPSPFGVYNDYRPIVATAAERGYALLRDGRIDALYVIKTTTEIASGAGFGPPFSCIPGTVVVQASYARSLNGGVPNSYDCLSVGPVAWPPADAADRFATQLAQAVAARGGVPAQAIEAWISAGYGYNRTDVRLIRFPERDGLADGQWHPGSEGASERRYIDDLLHLATGLRPLVARGTWGGLAVPRSG